MLVGWARAAIGMLRIPKTRFPEGSSVSGSRVCRDGHGALCVQRGLCCHPESTVIQTHKFYSQRSAFVSPPAFHPGFDPSWCYKTRTLVKRGVIFYVQELEFNDSFVSLPAKDIL